MMGTDIVLTPTRPVLKAIARACRCPPWSVGRNHGNTLDEELQCFQAFIASTVEEKTKLDEMFNSIAYKARNVWANATLSLSTSLLLGVHIPMSIMECVIVNSDEEPEALKAFSVGLNEAGFSSEVVSNSRGTNSLRLVEARGGERILVHVGRVALECLQCTERIRGVIDQHPYVRAAICAIDMVMRQSKYSDDGNIAGGVSTEVIALMVVAMLAKYPDNPPADRILMDFFITYGYHFDCQAHAISLEPTSPEVAWPPKAHPQDQFCVIDPTNPSRNLASGVTKFPQVKSLFQYCYMTLNQWKTMAQESRAQSPLSTIIGGETFWGRVLLLALAGEEPYATVVNEKKPHMRI
jgi:DNA polymerase sigma